MATIDLGRIKFKWQGAWSSSTSYVVDDVVESGGNAYVCIAASTNNVPPNATYWELMAQKGTDTSVATTQGDIIYHNGSSLARLGAGTSGQVLQTGGTGANPSWVDSSGGLVQTVTASNTSRIAIANSSFTATGISLNITPSSTSNKIFITACGTADTDSNGRQNFLTIFRDSTNLGGSTGGIANLYPGASNRIIAPFSMSVLDSPNTTSQITYQIYMRSNDGNNAVIGDQSDHAFITAMEVSV